MYLENQKMTEQMKSGQVGGDHYKNMEIDPSTYITKNKIGWLAGNVIKYVSRDKGNYLEDLKKAKHYLNTLIREETMALVPVKKPKYPAKQVDFSEEDLAKIKEHYSPNFEGLIPFDGAGKYRLFNGSFVDLNQHGDSKQTFYCEDVDYKSNTDLYWSCDGKLDLGTSKATVDGQSTDVLYLVEKVSDVVPDPVKD
jgi:hypothetical protein